MFFKFNKGDPPLCKLVVNIDSMLSRFLATRVSRGHVGAHGDPLANSSVGGPNRLAICGQLDLDPGIFVCVFVSG